MRVAVIGGGAAGFFYAINAASENPEWQITIYEQSKYVLAKVKVSGGGRCNVTHACFTPSLLAKFYPRGDRFLKPLFERFQPKDTIRWFEKRGVPLKTEADNRMFPATDKSQTIINCFERNAQELGVQVELQRGVQSLKQADEAWELQLTNGDQIIADRIMVATGAKKGVWDMLEELGHHIVDPVPSLFTFNIEDERLKDIPGVSVPWVRCKVAGTKLESEGPLLVTHWGLSGPAILKMSSFGARLLAQENYDFTVLVNFLPDISQDQVREQLLQYKHDHGKQKVGSNPMFELPKRLWSKLTLASDISADLQWMDLSKKNINRLIEQLSGAQFKVDGKSTFKEEFVTAGGVSLYDVDPKTMESKLFPGLFFAGEVLDIDAVTGGFNFQAAWTTSWVASQAIK